MIKLIGRAVKVRQEHQGRRSRRRLVLTLVVKIYRTTERTLYLQVYVKMRSRCHVVVASANFLSGMSMNSAHISSLVLPESFSADKIAAVPTIIAIPACNEEDRIFECLAALSVQRDGRGRRIPPDAYRVLLYANNCRDSTVARAKEARDAAPPRIDVVEAEASKQHSAAGLARKVVMDIAASQLEAEGLADGVILTTDADSVVHPTWLANSWQAFTQGADCVAGYVDADPREFVGLGRDFQLRGFLEEHYHAIVAEIFALLDPRPNDPWPNHQVSSGASLGITLQMYRAIGGLPPLPAGEDAALTLAVECAGGRVRHAMDVCVSTSCRLDGRAAGGAADAMKLRHAVIDTFCDEELEAAFAMMKKAWLKGHLRKASDIGFMQKSAIFGSLDLTAAQMTDLLGTLRQTCFEVFWQELCRISTTLRDRNPLRPSMLPAEIARGETLLHFLRAQPDALEAIDFVMKDGVAFETRLHGLNE